MLSADNNFPYQSTVLLLESWSLTITWWLDWRCGENLMSRVIALSAFLVVFLSVCHVVRSAPWRWGYECLRCCVNLCLKEISQVEVPLLQMWRKKPGSRYPVRTTGRLPHEITSSPFPFPATLFPSFTAVPVPWFGTLHSCTWYHAHSTVRYRTDFPSWFTKSTLKSSTVQCTVQYAMRIEGRRHSWRTFGGNGGMGDVWRGV